MTSGTPRAFDHVVGGEQPLSPAEAALWLDAKGDGACGGEAILHRLGCADGAALWLRYGRSALGIALELAGAAPDGTVALPDYQCDAVVDKLVRITNGMRTYPVDLDLTPTRDAMAEVASQSDAILTCAYFGSPSVDAALAQMAPSLRELSNRPWVIEDRVMAFPDPAALSAAMTRCDFLVLSLRKVYPVPDGAVLIACSERAAAALTRWRGNHPPADAGDADRALRAKVEAKVKRHGWMAAAPMADAPGANAVAEARASEALVDAVAGGAAGDGIPGSAGSVAYLLGRDLDRDFAVVRDRSHRLAKALPDLVAGSIPLPDCAGIAIPMLIEDRAVFRDRLAADGVFLPVHWPRHPSITPGPAARRWYDEAVSFPLLPARPDSVIAHLLSRVRTRAGRVPA